MERWARELSTRLPVIGKAKYQVEFPPSGFEHRLGQPWEQVLLPVKAARISAPLILCPANLAPVASRNTVVVVHDAAPLRFPGDYSKAYVAWQRLVLPRIVRRARCVITPSEFSKQELVETCGADSAKVRVVSPGIRDELRSAAKTSRPLGVMGLDEPYVLVVASKIGRKNLGVLQKASEELRKSGVSLVSVGGGRPEMRSGEPEASIRSLGPVDESQLLSIYAGASALVLPSVYEGYGLPVIEAMASGVPVVCSNAAALPQAAGGAALLVDPHDCEGFASALMLVVTDQSVRSELIDKGLERTRGMTWDATARTIDSICLELIAQTD